MTDLSEQQILKAMRTAGMDRRMTEALTYDSWKDGIDIQRASSALVAFVQVVRKLTPET